MTKYQPYVTIGEYLGNGAKPEEVKAVENLESQLGFSLKDAVIEKDSVKPVAVKDGVEKHDVSKLVCIRHKGIYVYVEQRTLSLIDGKVFKKVR